MESNYNNLLLQIITYANQVNSPSFIDAVPFFISMGQDRIWSELKTLGYEKVEEVGNFVVNKAIIDKPANWNETISIVYGTTASAFTNSTVLFPRSYEFCINYWPNSNQGDKNNPPLFYADRQKNQAGGAGTPYEAIFISPTPVATFAYQLTYLCRVNYITNENQKNVLTDYYPNLLFYSCFLEALIYLKDDQRMPVYQGLYQNALAAANELTKDRYTDRGVKRDKD